MRVAILLDDGFQDAEVIVPYYRLQEAGCEVDLIGPEAGAPVTGKYGYTFTADVGAGEADAAQYAALVVPGGYAPGKMRVKQAFVDLVAAASEGGAVLAAICHGPQLLIEAGVVEGCRMTSYTAVRTDLRNAGADWVDAEVVLDEAHKTITSRNPDDLPAFCACLADVLTAGSGTLEVPA